MHAIILVQALEALLAKGVDPMTLSPGAKPGEPGHMPSSAVSKHLTDIAAGLHQTLYEETQRALQKQQAQAQQNAGMFGNSFNPVGAQQPQEYAIKNDMDPGSVQMHQSIPQPTHLDGPGVDKVPLAQGQRQSQQGPAPTIMPQQVNGSQNGNGNNGGGSR